MRTDTALFCGPRPSVHITKEKCVSAPLRGRCHGDDFTIVGEEEELHWISEKMKTWFEIKVRALMGPDPVGLGANLTRTF